MARITDIRKTKKGRYSIYIYEEYQGVLHLDIYLSFPYKVGDDISGEALEDYFSRSQMVIAKERALRLLSARSYTAFKLKEKLLEDVSEEAADAIIERMEELGLVNDTDYALRYAKDCLHLKGYSYYHIKGALRQKGISRETIEETLEQLGEEPSEALIYRQIRKKLAHLGDEKGAQKVMQSLQRKGFRYGEIKQVMENLKEDPDYYAYSETD